MWKKWNAQSSRKLRKYNLYINATMYIRQSLTAFVPFLLAKGIYPRHKNLKHWHTLVDSLQCGVSSAMVKNLSWSDERRSSPLLAGSTI